MQPHRKYLRWKNISEMKREKRKKWWPMNSLTWREWYLTGRQCGGSHLFGHDPCSCIVNLSAEWWLGQNTRPNKMQVTKISGPRDHSGLSFIRLLFFFHKYIPQKALNQVRFELITVTKQAPCPFCFKGIMFKTG